MAKHAPFSATSISLAYVEAEDRIALLAGAATGDRLAMMVTRRLAIRLVNGLAGLLERTSAVAQEAPSEVRGDVVMFEHQGALAAADGEPRMPRAVPSTLEQGQQSQVASILIDAVDVTTHPDRFTLAFKAGGGALATMKVNRADLHRVVALLRRKCEEADWRVPIEALWLDASTGSVTLN